MAADDPAAGRRVLRKRRRDSPKPDPLATLLAAAPALRSIVVVSGSGLSASAGLATFSTPGGLYERAARAARLADGKALFTWSFYARRRADALAFLADVADEVGRGTPTAAHAALSALARAGVLRRHYTLNVDGLAAAAGMTTWHPEACPDGTTVELHGNARDAVCPTCEGVLSPAPAAALAAWRARADAPCPACTAPLRPRVMLYEDAEGDVITHPDVLDALEEDVAAADAVLWVGLSFEQSATTAYFRRARAAIAAAGRTESTLVALVNPCDDAAFNLVSAVANAGALAGALLDVRATADDLLPRLVERVVGGAVASGGVKQEEEKQEEEKQEEVKDDEAPRVEAAADAPAEAASGGAAAALFPPAVTCYSVEDKVEAGGGEGQAADGCGRPAFPTLTASPGAIDGPADDPPPPPRAQAVPPPPFTLTASQGD